MRLPSISMEIRARLRVGALPGSIYWEELGPATVTVGAWTTFWRLGLGPTDLAERSAPAVGAGGGSEVTAAADS